MVRESRSQTSPSNEPGDSHGEREENEGDRTNLRWWEAHCAQGELRTCIPIKRKTMSTVQYKKLKFCEI